MPVIAVSFTLWHDYRKARPMSQGERVVILLSLALVAGWALSVLDLLSERMEESYLILLFYFFFVSVLLLVWWGSRRLVTEAMAGRPPGIRPILAGRWDHGRFAHLADLPCRGLPHQSDRRRQGNRSSAPIVGVPAPFGASVRQRIRLDNGADGGGFPRSGRDRGRGRSPSSSSRRASRTAGSWSGTATAPPGKCPAGMGSRGRNWLGG